MKNSVGQVMARQSTALAVSLPSVLTNRIACISLAIVVCWTPPCRSDEVIFSDDFEHGLSSLWSVSELDKNDYRIRDGGLDIRVQRGKLADHIPMMKVTLPVQSTDVLIASVDVTILDRFTEPCEFAGLFLTADGKVEFGGRKQYVDGHMLFSPYTVMLG